MDKYFGNVVCPFLDTWFLCSEVKTREHFPSLPLLQLHEELILFTVLQCELDIMLHLEKAHFMLDEMVMNGCIVETNKTNILQPIMLMDKMH